MIEILWTTSIYAYVPVVIFAPVLSWMSRGHSSNYGYTLWATVLWRLLLPVFIRIRGNEIPWHAVMNPVLKETLEILYIGGVLTTTGYFLNQYIRIRRQTDTAVRETENVWRCEGISSAFVMGLIRPKIFLPYDLTGTDRWYVILHEKTHIRQGDLWINIMGTVCLCLHWWNPLTWYTVRKVHENMEMYCDEKTLETCATPERKIYADVLFRQSARQSGLSGLYFGESHTEQRIRNILETKKQDQLAFLFCYILVLGGFIKLTWSLPGEMPGELLKTLGI